MLWPIGDLTMVLLRSISLARIKASRCMGPMEGVYFLSGLRILEFEVGGRGGRPEFIGGIKKGFDSQISVKIVQISS